MPAATASSLTMSTSWRSRASSVAAGRAPIPRRCPSPPIRRSRQATSRYDDEQETIPGMTQTTRIQAIASMVPGSPSISRSRRLQTAPPRSGRRDDEVDEVGDDDREGQEDRRQVNPERDPHRGRREHRRDGPQPRGCAGGGAWARSKVSRSSGAPSSAQYRWSGVRYDRRHDRPADQGAHRQARASTATTAAPRSSPADCATRASRSSTRASARRPR